MTNLEFEGKASFWRVSVPTAVSPTYCEADARVHVMVLAWIEIKPKLLKEAPFAVIFKAKLLA